MKFIIRSFKEIKTVMFVMLVLFFLTSYFLIKNSKPVEAYGESLIIEAENNDDNEILKYNRDANINENFEDNKVVVIIKSTYDGLKEIGFEDFKIVNKVSEISSISYNLKQIKRGSGEKIKFVKEKNHILTLELTSHSKEKVISVITLLKDLDMVLVAEPSFIYEVETLWSPRDSTYKPQWGLNGTYGIQVEQAWNITRGNPDFKVGIMERGIDMEHEDLKGRVFPGNFNSDLEDDLAHGTHVAGIIGAKKNDRGFSGVTDCSMYLLNNRSDEFVNSLNYATQNNIKVINASFNYKLVNNEYAPYDSAHYTALSNYDGLFVVSAGNVSGEDNDEIKHYPACYDLPNIISVSSIDSVGKSSLSNYGKKSVDLYAPGETILSTYPTSICDKGCDFTHYDYGYHFDSGTSMAAPFVSGVAALIFSKYPNIPVSHVKSAILDNVDKMDSLTDKCVSGGRLNAYNAVKNATDKHTYNFAMAKNGKHMVYCECGYSYLAAHQVSAGTTGRYVECVQCGAIVDTNKYPVIIRPFSNGTALMSLENTIISSTNQLENYLNLYESDTVLTSEQRGAIIEYYDEKFFAEYSIMFGDIGFNEVSYWLLKNSLGWQAE